MNRSIPRALSRGRFFGKQLGKERVKQNLWNNIKIAPPHKRTAGEDCYKWMEKYGKDVSRRLKEEHAYCDDILRCCSSIHNQLRDEIFCYYNDEDDNMTSYTINGYEYYMRRSEEDAVPVFYRKQIGSSIEEIILDVNKEFSESVATLNNSCVSSDSRYLAYTVDTSGEEVYNLYIKDLNTGKVEVIKRNVYSFAFGPQTARAPDIYYTVANNLMRTNHIYRHSIGTSVTHDNLVFEEASKFYYCDVKRTNDGHYMVLTSTSKSDSEVYVKGGPFNKPTLLVKRKPNIECYIEHIQQFFVVLQSSKHASLDVFLVHEADALSYLNTSIGENGLIDCCFRDQKRIRLTSAQSPSIDLLSTYNIFDMDITRHHIILYERNCSNYRIRSLQLDMYDNNLSISEQIKIIPHIGKLTVGINPDPDSDYVTFTLSNPIMKGKDYKYSIPDNSLSCVQEASLPEECQINEEQFNVETQYIKSVDGQEIPTVFVTPKKQTSFSPILLSSYGCYGIPNSLHYTPHLLSLLKRGWSLGYPCIRGGGDVGQAWYEQGRKEHHLTSVADLDAVVGACAKEHSVSLSTNSAGGVIVGSLLNTTLHTIQSVLFHVPFLLLESILNNRELPLTVTEFDEWGDPSIPEESAVIHKLCPYANLHRRAYPNMFLSCGLKDKRTPYYNTLKYINRVRDFNSNENSVQVMRCSSGGHFYENDPVMQVVSSAEQLAFLIHSVQGDS